MNSITTAGPATSRLEQAATVETSPCFDFDRTKAHKAASFVLLLDLLDHGNGQKLDFISRNNSLLGK